MAAAAMLEIEVMRAIMGNYHPTLMQIGTD
jgi:hypothetical protein